MRVDLLKHNQEAYEKVQEAIKEGEKKIAISHATGTGKSYLVTKLFEDFNNDKKLVLVPSTYISDQIQALFEKYNIQNVDVMRYQKLIKMSDEDIADMDYDVIALDEYHHDTSKVWGNKVRTLIDTHSESIIFGTSATPIRSDGVNTIDELFEGNCASDLPLSESIAKKIVPLPKYVGALYELDDELTRLRKKVEQATNTKEEKQEFYKKIDLMRSQIEKSYGMPIILNKHIKDKEGKYLVFCKKKRHLQEIKETVIGWFRTAGCKNINAYEVYSDYENKDAEYKAFCEDTSHNLKLLFCVDMLNEGLHLENISGVLLLRPTRSSIVWHQQIGRAIEANNTNTPVIIDAVNNFSAVGQGMELMREIKDAVAREKESDPDFDDGGFEDIDTFFVVEQVVEIQEMFKAIEGRLEDDWDNGLRHFDKYVREHNGDVLVPTIYRDEDGFFTGSWVNNRRNDFDNKRLSMDRIIELEKRGFVWDVIKYKFESNIKAISEYFKEHEKYPLSKENKLGQFFTKEKEMMRKENYPIWRMEIIKKYLPEFCFETKSDESFNKFIEYSKLYKQKYGHLNIKKEDSINGYNIGAKVNSLNVLFRNNKLSKERANIIKDLGITLSFEYKWEKQFRENMALIQQAIEEGVIINQYNQFYKSKNMYVWLKNTFKKKYQSYKVSKEELKDIERLIGKSLEIFFNKGNNFVKVVDVIENRKISICKSQYAAVSALEKILCEKISRSVVENRLNGKVTTPYKGRFMFYYATDEEVKKYLEENKASQLQ